MAGEVVKVLNKGDKPFRDGWDNQQYVIEPGSEQFVPFDAIINWLGHPSAVDLDESRRDRLTEYTRLRVRYGAYENDGAWEDNKPNLEVFTLDGTRITTVVDDPEGQDITPEIQTVRENMLLSDRLRLMEEELKALRKAQEEEGRAAQAQASGQSVSADLPVEKPFGADTSNTVLDEPKESSPRESTRAAGEEADIPEDGPTRVKVQ